MRKHIKVLVLTASLIMGASSMVYADCGNSWDPCSGYDSHGNLYWWCCDGSCDVGCGSAGVVTGANGQVYGTCATDCGS
jgi:hypothetical protein